VDMGVKIQAVSITLDGDDHAWLGRRGRRRPRGTSP
jgi:hypothetical protein